MPSHTRLDLISILAAGLLTNCGGAIGVGGESPQKKKPKESTSTQDSELASDPQVVTGAYLACELSLTDTADAPAGSRAVGCNVMTAKGKPIQLDSSYSLEFSAKTPNQLVLPTSKTTQTDYQAIFHIVKSQLPDTTYHAKLLRGSTLVREFNGAVKDPTQPFSLTEMPAGIWDPLKNGQQTITSTLFRNIADSLVLPFATNPKCPASPDAFCDQSGDLSNRSPVAKSEITSCLGAGPADLMSDFAWVFKDGPAENGVPISISGITCAQPKKDRNDGGQQKYFSQGKKCSVVVLTDFANGKHSNPRTLVFKNSQLPFPADIMKKRFSVLGCGNQR